MMCLQRDALVEVNAPRIRLSEQLDKNRNLDDAHRVHWRVSVDCDFLAIRQELDIDTPIGADAVGDTFEIMVEIG